MFSKDNNIKTDPTGGYVKATANFKEEIKKTIGAENDYNNELFSADDAEFYSRLVIDLNTCFDVTWASTTKKILKVDSNGNPVNTKGSPYSNAAAKIKITKDEYVYSDEFVPSNGTNTFTW